MRSLIILEVEHGEDTDSLTGFLYDPQVLHTMNRHGLHWSDMTVRVDIPECFRLEP